MCRAPFNRRAGFAIGNAAARDGITGHLDEYHPTFHVAENLKAGRRNAWQTNDGSLEQCALLPYGLVRLGHICCTTAILSIRPRIA